MTGLVVDAPVSLGRQTVSFHDATASHNQVQVVVKPGQLLVWVSIAPVGRTDFSVSGPFPALVDTGTSEGLLIHESHLRQ